MNAAYCHVDCMLDHTVISLDAYKLALEVVVYLHIIKARVVFSVDFSDLVKLFLEGPSYERSHIEVECRDSLSTMHLVLHGLHGDAAQDAGSLDALCRHSST